MNPAHNAYGRSELLRQRLREAVSHDVIAVRGQDDFLHDRAAVLHPAHRNAADMRRVTARHRDEQIAPAPSRAYLYRPAEHFGFDYFFHGVPSARPDPGRVRRR